MSECRSVCSTVFNATNRRIDTFQITETINSEICAPNRVLVQIKRIFYVYFHLITNRGVPTHACVICTLLSCYTHIWAHWSVHTRKIIQKTQYTEFAQYSRNWTRFFFFNRNTVSNSSSNLLPNKYTWPNLDDFTVLAVVGVRQVWAILFYFPATPGKSIKMLDFNYLVQLVNWKSVVILNWLKKLRKKLKLGNSRKHVLQYSIFL